MRLGVDRPLGDPETDACATDGNRLQSPISPHLHAEVPRRIAYAERVAAGLDPIRVRPHPGAPAASWADGRVAYAAARRGMSCVVQDGVASPSQWTYAEGSECRALVVREGAGPITGQCVARETLAGAPSMATGAFDASRFASVVGRGLLDTCTIDRPCREDYICQQIPDFLAHAEHPASAERITALHARGIGFCTPTCFVYQLRLDGHPEPR